jgi:hypothetical protein
VLQAAQTRYQLLVTTPEAAPTELAENHRAAIAGLGGFEVVAKPIG